MGIFNNQDGTFIAKRIVTIASSQLEIKKTVVLGKIVDISRTSPIFTLVPNQNKNSLFQVKYDNKLEVFTTTNVKIKVSDLKSGHRIIAVLRPEEKTSKTYNAIRLIDLDFQPTATPTAK
jgi:hypothetical protein